MRAALVLLALVPLAGCARRPPPGPWPAGTVLLPPPAPPRATRPAPPAAGRQSAQPSAAARAVAFARAQAGTPYCWGGTGPGCFDCSGLTHRAWQAAGRPIPRTSSAQRAGLAPVDLRALRPGDVVWRPGHVGLYVGDGWAIHAPRTGKNVAYQRVDRYRLGLRP